MGDYYVRSPEEFREAFEKDIAGDRVFVMCNPTLHTGDIVKAVADCPLRSGETLYEEAVVVSVLPFALVSLDCTMVWFHRKRRDCYTVGRADWWQHFKCWWHWRSALRSR